MQGDTVVDLSKYHNVLGRKHQIIRLLWNIVWTLFARPLPRSIGKGWKRFLLRCFGAQIHPTAHIYSSAKVYYPPNLIMEADSCMASEVNCYNVDIVRIGCNTIVSQGAFLCTASHNINSPQFPLITAPIILEDQVWVGAEAFVGMGVTIGQGAVVGARTAVFRDVKPWVVVGGNPARIIKDRIIKYEN